MFHVFWFEEKTSLLRSLSPWTLAMRVVQSCQTTWRPCSDQWPWWCRTLRWLWKPGGKRKDFINVWFAIKLRLFSYANLLILLWWISMMLSWFLGEVLVLREVEKHQLNCLCLRDHERALCFLTVLRKSCLSRKAWEDWRTSRLFSLDICRAWKIRGQHWFYCVNMVGNLFYKICLFPSPF